MKKFLILSLFLIGIFSSKLFANSTNSWIVPPNLLPSYQESVSPVIFYSTNIWGNYDAIASSRPTLLHAVVVNSAGTASSFKLMNQWERTCIAQSTIATIDTTAKCTLTYNLFVSSGLGFIASGTSPADITLIFRMK